MTTSGSPNTPRTSPGWVRWAGWLLGVLLLAAAIAALSRHRDTLAEAWAAAREAPGWMVAALLIAPVVNIAVVSLSFSVMTDRYGRVGRGEMLALITSAWLLNHLPLRPGLVGRVAYHKFVNGIPVASCIRVVIEVLVCAALSLGSLLTYTLCAASLDVPGWEIGSGALLMPAVCALAASFLHARGGGRAERWLWCIALRQVDLIAWVGRYALVFAVLGRPLGWASATVVGAASEAAMLLPVQLGVREWVVGLVSARLASDPGMGLASVTPGLLADVLTRGVEVAVSLPTGVAATIWIHHRVAAFAQSRTVPPSMAV